ncbi:MAG: GTP cyclohydrolase I FolE [Oligoflexales bacterium]|nr:GTP cyclohydrolase I FolE [Oligoflexales bacterium]
MTLAHLTDNIETLLTSLGENPNRQGLKKTPQRFLDALLFLSSGYNVNLDEVVGDAVFDEPYQDMVVVRSIEFYSLCEHHMLPFYGSCHVGYIPNGKIIGLSKIPRIVEVFARRLQVQERLTHEIGEALGKILSPQGVGVVIEASHLCMMMRGVQKQNSVTSTSFVSGCFKKLETRQEFMSHVQGRRS